MKTNAASSSPRLRAVRSEPVQRATRQPRTPRALGVVAQVRVAFKRRNRLATLIGAALGGFVPVASFQLAHHEINRSASLFSQWAALLVLGGLVFSARSVYSYSKMAFGETAKSLGFCVILEGTLILSATDWLVYLALAMLVGINAVATGCVLSQGKVS